MIEQATIDHLLAKWEELRAYGQEISPEELVAASPELVIVLRARVEHLKEMDWLDDEPDLPALTTGQRCTCDEQTLNLKIPMTLGGRYELESLVAEGGFGQVWRARDRALERMVALKVTTVDCYAEARRVAQLKHHGIVSVHDVGSESGFCYIVFDLVEGMTLAERIERGPLRWQEAAEILARVAEYVHHAHEKGFVHRDIKPANILLDQRGRPVLADFGIAVTERELQAETLTSLGTLVYMSPEQLTLGTAIDARTDVYSLGTVLYEMLTGQPPFIDSTVSGLRAKILAGRPVSPRKLNPAVPEPLQNVCLRCLATTVADRYLSADELSMDLKRLLAM